MAVQLNHTIVAAQDKEASAQFLADILGLDAPTPFGPFLCVETANGVSLDYEIRLLGRSNPTTMRSSSARTSSTWSSPASTERQLTFWADPMHTRKA